MVKNIGAYKLDWDPITVEGFNKNKNEVIMVFNLDIRTEDKRQKVTTYVVGRTIWCCKNFPSKATITLSFDIRGQEIIMTKSNTFKLMILDLVNALVVDNLILIDFLR